MEFLAAKKDLLKAASRMLGVVDRKSAIPGLSNVLLTALDGHSLRLDGTDLFLGLSTTIAAEVKTIGTVALPAKELVERLKAMPDGQISLTMKTAGTAILKAVGSARRFSLMAMPGKDFPPIAAPAEDAPSLTLRPSALLELIARTGFAVSLDETRPHLNSMLIEWEGEVLRAVATDGHRLSKSDVAVDGTANVTMLIPLKAIHELRRLCEDVPNDEPITIVQAGSTVFFRAHETFSTKLVDATFPPYQQVIPRASHKAVRVPRATFADALRAVAVSANERTGGVKLVFGAGTLKVSSEDATRGDANDELPIDGGASLTIGFCAKYLLDVANALACPELELRLYGELDAAVLTDPNETPGHDFLAVVMPMRV